MNRIEAIEKKILDTKEKLSHFVSQNRFLGRKIVFTNGCFDLLHKGHLHYLAEAASLGNALIIGLNTDASVQRLKGPDRPMVKELDRAFQLASLQFVDAVAFFNEETPFNIISAIKPDVLVKGGDYEAEKIVGYDIVKQAGGEVKILQFIEGYSTTALINKIKKA